nr:hypothetical protein 12 [bacterium]
MSTTAIRFEPIGPFYARSLAKECSNGGAPGAIARAVIDACGDGGEPYGADLVRAAAELTRTAMGFVQQSRGWLTSDHSAYDPHQLKRLCDWKRLDELFNQPGMESDPLESNAKELEWAISTLNSQATRCHQHEMPTAGLLFTAAANLLKEVA